MNPYISIIVPVYNTEKYVGECIESILGQSIKDIEVIIIDDGSIDKSIEVIKKVVMNDKRVRILNQSNQGVSIARNNGIRIAKGEYIGFVDSDDWINKNMYEVLYNTAVKNRYDMVACNHIIEHESKAIIRDYDLLSCNKRKNIKEIMLEGIIAGDFPTLSCDKIFRRSMLINNNIFYEEGVNYLEDWFFNLRVMECVNKVGFIEDRLYNYRIVEGSLSHKFHKGYGETILRLHKTKFDFMDQYKLIDKEYKSLVHVNFINDIFKTINYYINYTDDNIEIERFLKDKFTKEKMGMKINNELKKLNVNKKYYIINKFLIENNLAYFSVLFCRMYKNVKSKI